MKPHVLLVAPVVLALFGTPARADPCRDEFDHLRAPIALTLGTADFASTPPACAHTAIAADARANILLDTRDFYGAIDGQAIASGAYALDQRTWLSASADVYRFTYVQNASVIATQSGVGPFVVGGHVVVAESDGASLAPFLRVLVPLESVYQHALRPGVEPGASGLLALSSRFALAGGISSPLTATMLGRRTLWQWTPRASVDGVLAVWRWLEVAGGFEIRLGTDRDGIVEFLAPKIALRFHVSRGLEVHVDGMLPLAGLDRTTAVAGLGVAYAW